MRELNTQELMAVSGGDPPPLIDHPQSGVGNVINDVYAAYINFLNRSVFPYVYYCL